MGGEKIPTNLVGFAIGKKDKLSTRVITVELTPAYTPQTFGPRAITRTFFIPEETP